MHIPQNQIFVPRKLPSLSNMRNTFVTTNVTIVQPSELLIKGD